MAWRSRELAEETGVSLNFEAAVAGGIPIIKTLREALAGNTVTRVYGILNGTCNYILTRMEQEGIAFAECLAGGAAARLCRGRPDLRRRRLRHRPQAGDPDRVAFGTEIDAEVDLRRRHLLDHAGRHRGGRRARLPDQAARRRAATETGIEQRVHPTMVPKSSAHRPHRRRHQRGRGRGAISSASSCSPARAPAATRPPPR